MNRSQHVAAAELTVAMWELADRCSLATEPSPQLNPQIAVLGSFDLTGGVLRPVGAVQPPLAELLRAQAGPDVDARLAAWERFPIRGAVGVDRAGRCVVCVGSTTTRVDSSEIVDPDAALLAAWARYSLGLEVGVAPRTPREVYGSMWCSALVLLAAVGHLDRPFPPLLDGTGPPLSPTSDDLLSWPRFDVWLGRQQVPPAMVGVSLQAVPAPLWSWLLAAVLPSAEQCELLLQCMFGDRYAPTWRSLQAAGLVTPPT